MDKSGWSKSVQAGLTGRSGLKTNKQNTTKLSVGRKKLVVDDKIIIFSSRENGFWYWMKKKNRMPG